MYMFPLDTQARKTQLLDKISPSFQTLILPFLVMIGVGLVQILVLAFLLMRGVLVPHRMDTPSLNGGHHHKALHKKQQ